MKVKFPNYLYSAVGYKPGKMGTDDHSLIYLSSNENNWGASPKAMAAIQENLSLLHRYPDVSAQNLRHHLAIHLNTDIRNIICGNGSDDLLYTLCTLYLREKGALLTSAGTFISIPVFSGLLNFPIIQIPLLQDYSIDTQRILEAIDDHTSIIYLANPNNPTGHLLPSATIKNFIDQVPSHILIILDEAYYEYSVYLNPEYAKLDLSDHPNVLRLRSFSKAYGLAGLRLGYGMGHSEICEILQKGRPAFTPSAIAQIAGIMALQDQDFVQQTVKSNFKEINRYVQFFHKENINYIPSHANFITPVFASPFHTNTIIQSLKKSGILVRPLDRFGLYEAVRISIGKPSENDQCINCLESIFHSILESSALI